MSKYDDCLGYIKYEGESVKDGFLDARKSAQALLGLDETIRYFVAKQSLEDVNFELPVKIQKGSWEVLIPYTIGLAVTGATVVATTYLSSASSTLAKNDFKDFTTKDLVKSALKKTQSVIRITKHIGEKVRSKITARVYDYPNQIIEIINDGGASIKITNEDYKTFLQCPENLLNKLADVIENDLIFKIGVNNSGSIEEEKIALKDRDLFIGNEIEEEEILPELKDGDIVELRGEITKGNERTNLIGLEYKGYILTCKPERGKIKQYKKDLFNKVIVRGVVHRIKEDKKPLILISSIQNLESDIDDITLSLF